MPKDRVWHYTVGVRFASIVADGVLLPAKAGVARGVRPCVWFSSDPRWEPTANKLWGKSGEPVVPLDRDGTAKAGRGLVRIGVTRAVASHDWKAYRRMAGEKKWVLNMMEQTGVSLGSDPMNWFVSFAPVPRSKWSSIDVWSEGRWENVPFDPVPQAKARSVRARS